MSTGMRERDEIFEQALNAPIDEPEEVDREALRFIRSWHQYGPLREALTYGGVNLGEMMETHLLSKVIPLVLRQSQSRDER